MLRGRYGRVKEKKPKEDDAKIYLLPHPLFSPLLTRQDEGEGEKIEEGLTALQGVKRKGGISPPLNA